MLTLHILLRKFVSFWIHVFRRLLTGFRVALAKLVSQDAVIPWSTMIDRGACIRVTDGGKLLLGEAVHIGENSLIVSKAGVIKIGDNAVIGRGCVIVSQESITIGVDALLGEYVSIRDQDHSFSRLPFSSAGYFTAPIVVGDNVWIGCKASVLKRSSIGGNVVIGAHSLVKGSLPDSVVAVGTPARVIRSVGSLA